MTTSSISELFGEVISSYSRQQAIEDGVLVQLSGPSYQGDDWMPAMCREAGFRFPIAMTVAAFTACVSPIEGSEGSECSGETLASCQDAKGRLWDVLWMLKNAIRRAASTDLINFQVYIVPNVPNTPAGRRRTPRAKLTNLKAVCGPGDDGEPVITVMFPNED